MSNSKVYIYISITISILIFINIKWNLQSLLSLYTKYMYAGTSKIPKAKPPNANPMAITIGKKHKPQHS